MITRENYELYFVDYIDGNLSDEDVKLLLVFLSENPDLKEELEEIGSIELKKPDVTYSGKEHLKASPELPMINLENFEDYLTKDIEFGLSEDEYQALDVFSKNHPEVLRYIQVNDKLVLKPGTFVYHKKLELLKLNTETSVEDLCIMAVEGILTSSEKTILEDLLQHSSSAKEVMESFEKTRLKAETITYLNKSSLYQKSGVVIPLWTRWAVAAAVVVLGFFMFNNNSSEGKLYNARVPLSIEPSIAEQDDFNFIIRDRENKIHTMPNTDASNDHNQRYIAPPEVLPDNHQEQLAVTLDTAKPVINDSIYNKSEVDSLKPNNRIIIPHEEDPRDQIAFADPFEAQHPKQHSYTLKGYVMKKANEAIMDEPEDYTDEPGYLALEGIEKVINKDIEFSQNDFDDRKTTSLSIGRFKFYRSKNK